MADVVAASKEREGEEARDAFSSFANWCRNATRHFDLVEDKTIPSRLKILPKSLFVPLLRELKNPGHLRKEKDPCELFEKEASPFSLFVPLPSSTASIASKMDILRARKVLLF